MRFRGMILGVGLWTMVAWGLCVSAGEPLINVVEFGAKGDAKTDNTAAFQKALDAAAKRGGGIVFAPTGTYLLKGHITIPAAVTLEGVWRIPQAYIKNTGTTLHAVEGAGNPDGTSFITLMENSTVKGISVFYPNQTETNPPVAYPWTIASGNADNCSIVDVYLANPYQAVDFGTKWSGRHFIRNLYAQPLYRGIFVDQCYDVGRIENVHFYPFWTWDEKSPIWAFMKEKGEAFTIARTDWEYMSNCFSIFYRVGFHFTKVKSGAGNVLLTQCGADISPTAVLVDDCQNHAGISFVNSQIYGDVIIGPENTGPVKFTACSFFGSTDGARGVSHAKIAGLGQTSFMNCTFVSIDPKNQSTASIRTEGAGLSVIGCDFMEPEREAIVLDPGAQFAIITGNRFRGVTRIRNESKAKVEIANNLDDARQEEPGAIVVDNSAKDGSFRTEGEWRKKVTTGDYLGGCDWATTGTGQMKAIWAPDLPVEGTYAVYVWYGPDTEKDRATDAPVVVRFKSGSKALKVNYRENSARWIPLGEFAFDKGRAGSVELRNVPRGMVAADAVKLVPIKNRNGAR